MNNVLKQFPSELRELPQWAVSGASKAPMAVRSGKLVPISVVEPSTWMTFEQASAAVEHFASYPSTFKKGDAPDIVQVGIDIGFILNEADAYTCIDLDVKDAENSPGYPDKWTTPDDFSRYLAIVDTFDSYTERSKSGKGIHIWVRGNIGKGFRRDGIEVYSQERYIISTGDVWIPKPLASAQALLDNMTSRMREIEVATTLVEVPEEADDWYILQIACNAGNSEKFVDLWVGKWKEHDFPSQSEADLALMSMFTFYSPSNAQCRRLFRASALGKREKAVRNDKYVNNTLKIIRTRQSQEAKVEIAGILQAADAMLANSRAAIEEMQGGVPANKIAEGVFGDLPSRVIPALPTAGLEPVLTAPPAEASLAQMAPVSLDVMTAGETGIAWPPGTVGAVAKYIYGNSFLPVKEISIASALGLMAGLTGKAWHIPKSGLNLYIVLVARSAIGKEALHNGIASIVSACVREFPQFGNFVDFTEYVSGPALTRACSQNSCFVNVSSEWGRRMRRMGMEDDRDGPMSGLRTQMTALYQKSDPSSIVGGLGYSSQENNIEALQSVAYSMVGESTPKTYYESLTPSMMEDGFMSRFIIITYDGDRGHSNSNIVETPDAALVKYLCSMAFQADTNIGNNISQRVGRTEEAAAILKDFSDKADAMIDGREDEGWRQMWNRAALKAMRLAAVLAVSDNYTHPIIEASHALWSIDLIARDIASMRARLESGDVGQGDDVRERKLISIMKSYLTDPPSRGYKVNEDMRMSSIIPRSFLQKRIGRVSAFYKHRNGTNKAMDDALNNLVQSGYIMEVKQDKLVEAFNQHGRAYRILRLPTYEENG